MINLAKLPAPMVVVPLDFEVELQALKSAMVAALPEIADVIDMESEPVQKILQVIAYEKIHMQARINDAAKACMLAYALGSDLDHLAALLGVQRMEEEQDDRLRQRAQMALEGTTVAGSRGSYEFHALGASAFVKDVNVDSPTPGVVRVTVLGSKGDGTPDADLLATVSTTLSAEDVRPLSDTVEVTGASIVPFDVAATLHIYPGPAAAPLIEAARQALRNYLEEHRLLGHDITVSGIYACLHQPGVRRVELRSPMADVVIAPTEAAHCTGIDINAGEADV